MLSDETATSENWHIFINGYTNLQKIITKITNDKEILSNNDILESDI